MLAFSITLSAQNKNVQKETKTTTVTVDNGTREQKVVKTESVEAQQEIKLKNAKSKKLNKEVKETPVLVKSSTTISGDGIPTQEIDRSSYYEMNGPSRSQQCMELMPLLFRQEGTTTTLALTPGIPKMQARLRNGRSGCSILRYCTLPEKIWPPYCDGCTMLVIR